MLFPKPLIQPHLVRFMFICKHPDSKEDRMLAQELFKYRWWQRIAFFIRQQRTTQMNECLAGGHEQQTINRSLEQLGRQVPDLSARVRFKHIGQLAFDKKHTIEIKGIRLFLSDEDMRSLEASCPRMMVALEDTTAQRIKRAETRNNHAFEAQAKRHAGARV